MGVLRSISTVLALAVIAVPLSVRAEMIREKTLIKVAEANFLTNYGCEDVTVGVNVTEKANLQERGSEPVATVLVFGSIIDNCEFGTSTFFFGTTTVNQSEFEQNGVDGATLDKTFAVDGTEIHLSLTWSGVGVIGGEDFKINEKVDGVHTKKTQIVDSRNAEVEGLFLVNGLNRISENSLVNAELTVVRSDTKVIQK